MSLESDKQVVTGLLNDARSKVEAAIVSFANNDFEKTALRIEQYNKAFEEANKVLKIVVDKSAAIATAEATKDER